MPLLSSLGNSSAQGFGIFSAPEAGPVGFPLPADSILIWDKTSAGDSVPTGFSEMDMGSEDFLIQGAILSDSNTTTFTSGTFTGAGSILTSSLAGSHSTPWSPIGAWPGSPTPPTTPPLGTRYDNADGNHSHTTTVGPPSISVPKNTLPGGMGVKLITNAAEVSEIPESAVAFSDTVKDGFARKTWDLSYGPYIAQKNTLTTVGEIAAVGVSFNVSGSSTSGVHSHARPVRLQTFPGTRFAANRQTIGNHSHPVTSPSLQFYVFQNFKHLLPLIATTDGTVKSGMIVMFKGASIPDGWSLCNGSNGTPNLVNYFIGYNNDETSTDVLVGKREVKNSATAPPTTGDASAPYSPQPAPVTFNDVTWPHNHARPGTTPTTRQTNTSFNRHTVKNVPHTHSSTIDFTIPSLFKPNTLRLAFIQKD